MRHRIDPNDEEYELLRPSETQQDSSDGDQKSMLSVTLRTISYQSTSRIISYWFIGLTVMMIVITCATLGASFASNQKAKFHITDGIMPSVNLVSSDCESLKYVNLTLHLLINCLGTVIIGCSNYLQQSTFRY